MLDKKTIQNRRSEFAEELHAGSVFRDIQAREKEREDYEKRWFWELLQNAKDSTDKNGKVNVRIEVNEDSIAFAHSGNAFELDEILSLIIQGSSKIDDDTKVGRFGTGFMTTYLLSKRVKITGKLTDDNGYFEFLLNRDTDKIKDFFRLQSESNDEFIKSLSDISYLKDSEYQTRFLYELNPEGKKTAKEGLLSLNELIPFTQLFNSQIHSITVSEKSNVVTYNKEMKSTHEFDNTCVEEWELTKSNELDKLKAYIIRNESADTVLVSKVSNGIEELFNVGNRYPKLYYTFPLIGTEEFGIPFIINSTSFDPKKERDGIYLNTNVEGKVGIARNKQLINDAIYNAIPVFTELVKKLKIKSVYNLYTFSKSKDYKWVDNEWLNNIKKQFIDNIKNIDCIPIGDKHFSLSSLYIPYSKSPILTREIWDLLNENKVFKTISKDEIDCWIQIYMNFAELEEVDIYDIRNIVGSKFLIKYLSGKKNRNDLKSDLNVNSIQWLNRLYFLINRDLDDFPLNKNIMLNQENKFVSADNVSWDKVNDKRISKISIKLELDFPKKLISNKLDFFKIVGVDDFIIDHAIDELKNRLNKFEAYDFRKKKFIKGNCLFIKWLIKRENVATIRDTKIVSLENNSENASIVSKVFPSGKHLLLAPIDYFKESFPLYADLIRQKDCLHPFYNKLLNSSDFEWLETQGFIHCSPLVKRTEILDSKSIELLISNPNDLDKIKDDEGKIKFDVELEYSDFAYLTTSEGHIYDRNSSTSSSFKIFNFLLNEATLNDEFFNNNEESININDENINFGKMLWLQRAKNIQWVNVKNIEQDSNSKFSKEVPSSKNLSELIKNDSNLINTIRGESQISFLSMINVGVSDLIRNTLPSDDIRISWDKALTNMITSNVNPELVQEIFSDQGIQDEYNNRLKQRKLIKRNQNIGALVEDLFKILIEELKKDGTSINIEREPFGSDYLLIDESSDLVVNNQEVLFRISDWLIELKATGKSFAAMTSLQAENAVKYKEHYALIVVPLDGSELDINFVKNNARVISNIGYKLKDLYNNFTSVEKQKDILMNDKEDVSVSIENQNIRFRINASLWQHNSRVRDFIIEKFNSK